jgi:competence protein ComEA
MRIQRNPLVVVLLFLSLFGGFATASYAAPVSADVATQSQVVNINSASAEELAQKLNGIGASKAKAIVEYREKIGKFVSIDQLTEVKGIGKATVDKNRAVLSLK